MCNTSENTGNSSIRVYLCALKNFAGVMKLVDMLDLGSSASRRGGSSPSTRTFQKNKLIP